MISAKLNKRQVNQPTTFTAADVALAAEFLYVLQNPASLPLEYDIADRWFKTVFLQQSREFRDEVRERYEALRNAREVG